MDNEVSIGLKTTTTTMETKYQLVLFTDQTIQRDPLRPSKTLFIRTMQRRLILSHSIVGQITTSGNNQSKYAKKIKDFSQHISLYPHIRII